VLSLRLGLQDIGTAVEPGDREVSWGRSVLRTFGSRHIQVSVRATQAGTAIWIGEARDPWGNDDATPEDFYRGFRDHAGVAILLNPNAGQAQLVRTTAGSFPLFVTSQDGILTASWRFEEVVQAIADPRPNIEACRRQLEHGLSRVRSQIIADMFMLWPGESVAFGEDGLRFRDADPIAIVLPTNMSDAARATDAFIDLIADVIRPSVEHSEHPLIEVSGGLDSACVAVAASRLGRKIESYGVIHDGAAGVQQRRRRAELVSLLGLDDHEAPSFLHTPFASLAEQQCRWTPYDCPYRIPCVRAIESIGNDAIDMALTGIGGDELTMTNTYVHEDWELEGLVSVSAIVAAVGRADMFMRLGIWPVSPLVHPTIVDFCRALPRSIRYKRLLNLLALARAGLSDGFILPRLHENFANCIIRETWMIDFDEMFSDSPIADFGIARVDALLNSVRNLETPPPIELVGKLFAYRQLDGVLKTYL